MGLRWWLCLRCLSNWTATVTEGADWLSLREKEGIGGYKTLGLVCEKFVVTVDKGQTADPASTVRNAVVVIKCGASEQTIHVTQTATVVEKVEEIEDIEKYYKPAEFGNMDMYSSASRWSFARMKQSEHFFVFWEAGFGDDPNAESVPAELRVDIDDLLQKAEKFYNTNITPGAATSSPARVVTTSNSAVCWMTSLGSSSANIIVVRT